jgi:ribosomal protein S18 acetylase RimI-like enzyme
VTLPVEIEEATAVTAELVEAFERLVPQLSRSSPAPSQGELQEMVAAPGTHVLIARDGGGTIVGTTTLVVFRIPTGMRAWIEDVIVDEAAAGQGIGGAINRYALDLARREGCKTVDLTSRPSREAANHLYRKLGFQPRETNVYRFTL